MSHNEPKTHPGALRNYAAKVREVWSDWTDEDVARMAEAVARDLERLAIRIERAE